MKYLKVIFAVLVAIVVFFLGLVILAYDAETRIPSDFRYVEDASLDHVESYLLNMDFEDRGEITLKERDLNIILKTFREYGLFDQPDFKVNYLYVDLEPSGGTVFIHTEVRGFLDFPTRLLIEFAFEHEDSQARVVINRVLLGKLRIPRALIARGLAWGEVDLPYFDENSLVARVDMDEINPYGDLVRVKTVDIDHDGIRVDYEMAVFSGFSDLAAGIRQTLSAIYPELGASDQAQADRLLGLMEEEAAMDSLGLELEGIFQAISLEGKLLFMDEVKHHLSQEEIEELFTLLKGW